jgi:hypothetical protein
MATIKLKSSTGTRTVPSSLAQGEMAINVADGNLFYGDNSSNVNNDFRFAQVGVTGLTSGHTVHGVTVSGGSGGVYGTLKGQVGTDATPLTAYINAGEIDNVAIGTESKITQLKTDNIYIEPSAADTVAFTLKANGEAEGNWMTVTNAGGDEFFGINSAGRTTIFHGTITTSDINGGNIDGTAIGATTPSTIVSTTVKASTLSGTTGTITGNLDVDGISNLDNTDIDGTLAVDGTTISLDATTSLNIDNSNTSNGITIGTATSGVPIQLGHSTSKVRINDDLTVTGNTVMNGTLSATTSLKVGNGDGTISANTVQGSYQFITFVGNTGALSNDYWTGPSTNGISNHSWTEQWDNHTGTTTGSTTLTLGRTEQMAYIRVPAGARLVGVEGVIRSNTNDRAYAGLFTFLPDYEGPDDSTATLRILAQTPSSSNNVTNDPQSFKLYAGEANQHIFADGECIVPAVRRGSTSNQSLVASFTIILKY